MKTYFEIKDWRSARDIREMATFTITQCLTNIPNIYWYIVGAKRAYALNAMLWMPCYKAYSFEYKCVTAITVSAASTAQRINLNLYFRLNFNTNAMNWRSLKLQTHKCIDFNDREEKTKY
jgi:hypothetical protein